MSLVEVMISAGILGFGVLALVKVYTHSVHGMSSARRMGVAQQIASQRAELLMTMGAGLPRCGGDVGCRASMSALGNPKAPVGSVQCTQYVDGPVLPGIEDVNPSGRFRIDTHVAAHPGANQLQDGDLVTVSVCWKNDGGQVHQIQATRLVLPGV